MTILDAAAEIVDGARQKSYGHPRENHGATAEFWTTYLARRGLLAPGAVLDAHDVCDLNILQKISRDANSRQLDNLVDIAGFARNAEMVDEEPERQRARVPLKAIWPEMPDEFPLKWQDQSEDILKAINLVRVRTHRDPDLVYVPGRSCESTSMTIWGILLAVDSRLPDDEFAIKFSGGRFTSSYRFRFGAVR